MLQTPHAAQNYTRSATRGVRCDISSALPTTASSMSDSSQSSSQPIGRDVGSAAIAPYNMVDLARRESPQVPGDISPDSTEPHYASTNSPAVEVELTGTSEYSDSDTLLRRRIQDIQSSRTLDDKEKARYTQALMMRNYMMNAKPSPALLDHGFGQPLSIEDQAKTYHNEAEEILGCKHYRRQCKLQCSTCHAWTTCRFCHNEKVSDHELIRTDTKLMLCMLCTTVQPAAQYCNSCTCRLAAYYCNKCKLWDDDENKHIYHCSDCGICRVGHGLGKDFFRMWRQQ